MSIHHQRIRWLKLDSGLFIGSSVSFHPKSQFLRIRDGFLKIGLPGRFSRWWCRGTIGAPGARARPRGAWHPTLGVARGIRDWPQLDLYIHVGSLQLNKGTLGSDFKLEPKERGATAVIHCDREVWCGIKNGASTELHGIVLRAAIHTPGTQRASGGSRALFRA